MTTGKTIALTIWTFIGQVMFLLFNTLSRFVIAFLPRSKCLLISWLQSPLLNGFGAQENKICHWFHFSRSICHEVMRLDDMMLVFECRILSQFFHFPLSPSWRGSFAPLHFLPLEWHHLHVWGCWHFFWLFLKVRDKVIKNKTFRQRKFQMGLHGQGQKFS